MTEKTKSVILALVTGSSGSSAQFAGKKSLGWGLLLFCWVVLPAVIWLIRTNTTLNPQMPVILFYSGIILVHLALALYHGIGREASQSIDAVRSRTGRIALSVLIMFVLAYISHHYVFTDRPVDTSKAKPVVSIASVTLSQEFLEDEKAFRKQYDRQVIKVTGKVVSIGEDFSEGSYIALEGYPGSPTDVNCYFLPERQAEFTIIASGQEVSVTGVVDGRFLRNCYLNKP